MTSRLEAAARALYDEEFGSHGSDTDFQDMHDYWKRSALAVLKAIREPEGCAVERSVQRYLDHIIGEGE